MLVKYKEIHKVWGGKNRGYCTTDYNSNWVQRTVICPQPSPP